MSCKMNSSLANLGILGKSQNWVGMVIIFTKPQRVSKFSSKEFSSQE